MVINALFTQDQYYLWTLVSAEIWSIIYPRIFTSQMTDLDDSHGIENTDHLHNYYKLPKVPR